MSNNLDKIRLMLEEKQKGMIEFLNAHMSPEERNRIGEDIIRLMPNTGDVAKILIKQYRDGNPI